MPIKGLTDRGASFPRIGELRKGGEKPTGNKPGADLTHFRFTSQHSDVTEDFTARYGTHPTAVNCYLPFRTASENFEAWIEEWGAGGLRWRGDGETLVIWQTPDGKYSQEPKPQPAGGKQAGRLKLIIPELGRLAYVTALTTSINDILEMQSTLDAYEALRGDLRGIPFILSRVPRMVSTPGKDGQRVRREKWLWHLEAQPAWVQAQLSVMQRDALPTGIVEDRYQLESGSMIDAEEVDDIPAHPQPQVPAPAQEEAVDWPGPFLDYIATEFGLRGKPHARNALRKAGLTPAKNKAEAKAQVETLRAFRAKDAEAEKAEVVEAEAEPLTAEEKAALDKMESHLF
jgi:hypothetical protein